MNSLPAYLPDNKVLLRIDELPPVKEATVYDDISTFASRICSVTNTAVKMAAPICSKLCQMANDFPLVINLLAAGVSLAIALPSGPTLPFFAATGMMLAGCQIRHAN